MNDKKRNRHDLSSVIKGCRNNNRQFQELFYETYYAYALKIVFRYIYRYEKSVDIVHDGFIKVFKNIAHFELPEADGEPLLLGWIRKIMINTAIDYLRKNEMIPEIGGLPESAWDETDKSTAADQLLLYKELITEIKKLPPSYRAVFNLFAIDGYSHQEIAEMLGISAGTSKSSLFKARNILQKALYTNYSLPKYAAGK